MNYTKDKTTYFATPKTDIKDRIELEVGDSKQPDFYPQVKIMRWDNEVNLSYRLKDSEIGTEKVTDKDGKIVWSKGNLEAHFYDLSLTEHPEGALEFDVVLKEKPLTNKVEFTLNDKGVEYFYQPALTEQEIGEGASRPDNVVGSYAVYAKTPKTNWTGGKEYKCGKVGMFYAPEIIDSAGNKVKGDLHIENGILSVTIPQDFLDKADYTNGVRVDPTFGYTTAGATSVISGAPHGCKFQFTSGGSITTITSYLREDIPGTVPLGNAIYSDVSGTPTTKLAVDSGNATIDGTSPAWYTTNLSYSGTASTNYWLAMWASTGSNGAYYYYDAGSANQRSFDTSDISTFEAWRTTWVNGGFSARATSIYATYTEPAFLGFNIALV